MRVALTGANGFTGRFVATALNRIGVTPVTLQVDLCDKEAVDQAVDELDFDHVIHLAARAFVHAADWRPFYATNQIGTFNLLDALSRKKEGMRCIIASSAQIYGPHAKGLIAESVQPNPVNHYAISKYSMEMGARLWADRLEIVVTRPFNYTGLGQETSYLIPKIVDHFQRRAPVIELGNTWVQRDFGDVRSVADAYAQLVAASDVPSVVNISTGSLYSINDIIEKLAALSGHEIEVAVNPAFVRKGDVDVLGGDATLLRTVLPDWHPRLIDETLHWIYSGAE